MAERGRFAPTPSGRMHLGNVFSALLAWLSVRAAHGELVLRIEDLDTLRCSAENAEVLKDDLRWLGLTWDAEQPDQSTRSEYYESILDRLRGEGFVYPCWCTRGDLKNAANAPNAELSTRLVSPKKNDPITEKISSSGIIPALSTRNFCLKV